MKKWTAMLLTLTLLFLLAACGRGGDAPLTRKMFAFWPEKSDSSLQWEFAEALRQHIK